MDSPTPYPIPTYTSPEPTFPDNPSDAPIAPTVEDTPAPEQPSETGDSLTSPSPVPLSRMEDTPLAVTSTLNPFAPQPPRVATRAPFVASTSSPIVVVSEYTSTDLAVVSDVVTYAELSLSVASLVSANAK